MIEYDNDELDDYSSANSFRARSNTWPLNKPDLTAPSSNVCIDETLPEVELEEDDLFTTNENWSGFVDHDIMSWDPILNAQNNQQTQIQPPIIHHQPQPRQATNHVQQINEQQQQQQPQQHHQTSQGHQRLQSIHLHHQQISRHHHDPPQQQHLQQHRHNHHAPSQQQQQQQQQVVQQHHPTHHLSQPHQQSQLDAFLDGGGGGGLTNELMIGAPNGPQIQQQASPHQHEQLQHQTLNSSSCLDTEDPNEYHIHQLHHLRLDGPNDPQQERFSSTVAAGSSSAVSAAAASTTDDVTRSQMSSISMHSGHHVGDYAGIGSSSDHQHHHHHHSQHQQSHLQPLTSARYNFDHHHPQSSEFDLKLAQDVNLSSQQHHHTINHLDDHEHSQQTADHHTSQHQHHHQFDHHHQLSHHHQQHIQQSQHIHQFLDLTASSLDNGNCGSHMLSSSLSTSGIGLSTDLEDLDYKPVNASTILSNSYEDTLQQQQQHHQQDQLQQQNELQSNSSETVKSELQSPSATTKQQTDSTSASKTKLNAPRRNAWGNMSYADLISQAIESTSDKRLTLSQIYDWMVQHVPYFKDKGDSNSSAGWKNSVRHNLSLHSRFKRLQNEGTGKSSWWTINPEANVGKCARRRAASMEASKYEKKRGRAKKRAEAIRQGLVSYPSLTNSSLNGSTNTLGEQQTQQAQSLSHFHTTTKTTTTITQLKSLKQQQQQQHQQQQQQQPQQAREHNLQHLDQLEDQQQQQQLDQFDSHQQQSQSSSSSPSQQQQIHMPQLQIQSLENYNIDQPSQQQQQHLRQLQQADRQERQQQNCGDSNSLHHDMLLFI